MINDIWPSINPGEFRHKVSLLSQVNAIGKAGMETTWSPGDTPVYVWAKIEFLRGDELVGSGIDISRAYLKVTSHYSAAFSGGQRIQTADGKQYIIQYPENVKNMNIYMVLTCLAIGANT